MANTKIATLEVAVKEAAEMAIRAKPGYGQTLWVEARASLQILVEKVARGWAATQGHMVTRAEMRAEALDLIQQELATRAANLRDYRLAAEVARLAAAKAAPAQPTRRKAALQTAATAQPTRRKAALQAAATLKTAAKAAPARSARPAMDLEALIAAGFARQAAAAAKKAGATPADIKAARKAAKKVAKVAKAAQKAAKKAAQAAFKAAAAGKAAAKTKGRKA